MHEIYFYVCSLLIPKKSTTDLKDFYRLTLIKKIIMLVYMEICLNPYQSVAKKLKR